MLSCMKHCPFGGKPPYIFVGSLRLTISQVQSQHGRQPGCPGEGQSTGPSTCTRKLGCSEASVAMGRDGLLTPRERCDSSRWSGIPFPQQHFQGDLWPGRSSSRWHCPGGLQCSGFIVQGLLGPAQATSYPAVQGQ